MTDITTAEPAAICPSCGEGVRAGARFCRSCGTELAAPPTPTQPAASPSVAAPPPTPAGIQRLPSKVEFGAGLLPVVALLVVVVYRPSVLEEPSLYVVWAFAQAVVFLLLIRAVDLYEREPYSLLVLMMFWGGSAALVLAFIGNAFVDTLYNQDVSLVFGAAISAPIGEEIAKGLALVGAFALAHWAHRKYGWLEFEGVTDGIVYGAAVGLGFALVEDIQYFMLRAGQEGTTAGLETFITRVDLFGAMSLSHAVYTAAFGAGLGLATWSRTRAAKIGWPLLGLGVAMLLHATWNGLDNFAVFTKYGWNVAVELNHCFDNPNAPCVLPDGADPNEVVATYLDARDLAENIFYVSLALLVVAIALWLRYQRKVIRLELTEEVSSGLITEAEPNLILNHRERTRRYWGLLRTGHLEEWKVLRRLHTELVHLAFAKWRVRRLGGDPKNVERQRRRIELLKSHLAEARRFDAGLIEAGA